MKISQLISLLQEAMKDPDNRLSEESEIVVLPLSYDLEGKIEGVSEAMNDTVGIYVR